MRPMLVLLAGAVAVLALQLQFSLLWSSYYSRYPWPGYQAAMKGGFIPPFLTASPRSYLVGGIVLALLPGIALRLTRLPLLIAFPSLWTGAMAALVAIWVATPRLRNDSNMWPIDLVFLAIAVAAPLAFGSLAAALVRNLSLALDRHRRGS